MDLNHSDIKRAFVQSRIDRELFFQLLKGCRHVSCKVLWLDMALYGLRRFPRISNQLLMQELLEFGSERCDLDPSVLFRRMSPVKKVVSLVVGIHVDNTIVTGEHDECKSLRKNLDEFFPTRNLGALSYSIACEKKRLRHAGFVRFIGCMLRSACPEVWCHDNEPYSRRVDCRA